jgi:hypothetical protein
MQASEVERRFDTLVVAFRVKNTLELNGGKYACLPCRKIFRSAEYLNLHFDRAHPQELQELKVRAQQEAAARIWKLSVEQSES